MYDRNACASRLLLGLKRFDHLVVVARTDVLHFPSQPARRSKRRGPRRCAHDADLLRAQATRVARVTPNLAPGTIERVTSRLVEQRMVATS